jgi:hypothetical protein
MTRARPVDYVLLCICTGIIALSVTRSYLLVGAVMVAIHLLVAPGAIFRARLVRTGLYVAGAALVLVLVTGDLYEMVLERWTDRMAQGSEIGIDLTAATRLAEAGYQWDAITSSWTSGLAGRGIGAPTELWGEYADLFWSVLPDIEVHSIGFGHTGPTSILFVGGWIVGGACLGILVWTSVLGLRLLRSVRRRLVDRHEDWLGAWGATLVVGALLYSLFGGIFGDRSQSLHLGVGFGMLLWSLDSHGSALRRSET